ncbi:MAG: calcineurin-like phosphoesterase C-terminal domain-containing protein [Bacteroidales bacterium]|nr:calcineurin-like phosphoesterase C-terminal domain-containing protein [Bacteroidales bacterium]
MKRLVALLICSVSFIGIFTSCEKAPEINEPAQEGFDLMISLPSTIKGGANDVVSVNFYSGKGPKEGDMVLLKKGTTLIVCDIVKIGTDQFSFKLSPELETGKYLFCIRRGSEEKGVREVQFEIEKRIEIVEKEGYNIYGIITCEEEGVPGVVISDGVEVTVTDENGLYYMKSAEKDRIVFMSIPSGYEALSDGILPRFHKTVDGNPNTVERADWNLVKVDNKDHVMYLLGDMHLADRTSDLIQFADFTADLKQQISKNKAKRQYALTLGDMTWDLYWYSNAYDLYSYIQTMNSSVSGLQIFHTIGNHDHDMRESGDFDTVNAFKRTVAPTYYSFNIGDVHYIVLDNILCTNVSSTDGSGRDYKSSLTKEQIDWLRKDLSYVDKSKTLVITMHAQMYAESGDAQMALSDDLEELCKGYQTHVMSAHTHVVWNNDRTAASNIYHHNSGAVCGTWWWTGHFTPGLGLCKDGSPSGYYVYEMNGADVKWRFKPTGKGFDYMFRSYDRNSIAMTASNFTPKADSGKASAWEKSASYWKSASSDNYIYVNVFDYDPSWTVEVTENGKVLKGELVKVKDPLHLAAYEAIRYNDNANPTSSFKSYTVTSHMLRFKASSANSTVLIKVTDRFGNTSSETMKRPKAFSLSAYNK